MRRHAPWRLGCREFLGATMSIFDFSMTPEQAAAFLASNQLTSRNAVDLAMAWLEAGSDSVAVASLAIEDRDYVSWKDISVRFREALNDLGAGNLSDEQCVLFRTQCILQKFLARDIAGLDFCYVIQSAWPSSEDGVVGSPPISVDRLQLLGREFDSTAHGDPAAQQRLDAVANELRDEALRVLAEIDARLQVKST